MSAEAVGVMLLMIATAIGIWIGRGFIPVDAEMYEARTAMGIMGGIVGSIIGSTISAIQVGSVKFARHRRVTRRRRELEAQFQDHVETYPHFEARLAPDMEGGFCWDLKGGTTRLGRVSEDDYLVFRSVVDQTCRPMLEVVREAGQVISTRTVQGLKHHDSDWAVRIHVLGTKHSGVDYRDYFYLYGQAVTRDALGATPTAAVASSRPMVTTSRSTDGLPRLPGVTRERDGLGL